MTYKELVEELKDNNIVSQGGAYYDYEFAPFADLFKFFWQSGQQFLESDEMQLYFDFPRLYFSTNTSENAAAYLEGKYSLIVVFMGAIQPLYSYYEGKKGGFAAKEVAPYNEVAEKFAITPDYYLFQIVALFFLYHETGHLIQRNANARHYMEFTESDCRDNVEERHVKEFDADWFASNKLAFHITKLNEELFGKPDTDEKVEFLHKSAELALAAIYIFLIRHSEYEPEIYYQEKCHPHSSVRLTYIIFYFVDTVRFSIAINLDQPRIIRNAIMISMEIMKEKEPNPVEEYSKKIYDNSERISIYINKVIEDCKRYPECCRNVLPIK